jgi:hypothetical protein
MPQTVWLPLLFVATGAFFLTIDLSMGVTRAWWFSIVRRDEEPTKFWIAEAPAVLFIVGGTLFSAYGAFMAYLAPLFR